MVTLTNAHESWEHFVKRCSECTHLNFPTAYQAADRFSLKKEPTKSTKIWEVHFMTSNPTLFHLL